MAAHRGLASYARCRDDELSTHQSTSERTNRAHARGAAPMRRMTKIAFDADTTQGALRQCDVCAWGYIGGRARTQSRARRATDPALSTAILNAICWARTVTAGARTPVTSSAEGAVACAVPSATQTGPAERSATGVVIRQEPASASSPQHSTGPPCGTPHEVISTPVISLATLLYSGSAVRTRFAGFCQFKQKKGIRLWI